MYLQLAVLKNIWEKSLLWTEILIKLRPSNTQPAISSKNGANVGPLCRSSETSIYLHKDLLKEASKSKFLVPICFQRWGAYRFQIVIIFIIIIVIIIIVIICICIYCYFYYYLNYYYYYYYYYYCIIFCNYYRFFIFLFIFLFEVEMITVPEKLIKFNFKI